MLCYSPASLLEGGGGKGAGGVLGIKPQDDVHNPKVTNYLCMLCYSPVPPPLLLGEAGEFWLRSLNS